MQSSGVRVPRGLALPGNGDRLPIPGPRPRWHSMQHAKQDVRASCSPDKIVAMFPWSSWTCCEDVVDASCMHCSEHLSPGAVEELFNSVCSEHLSCSFIRLMRDVADAEVHALTIDLMRTVDGGESPCTADNVYTRQ